MTKTIEVGRTVSLLQAVQIYADSANVDDGTEVIVDFANAGFIYANFTAILGAVIQKFQANGHKITIISPTNDKTRTVLCKNNFLPFFDNQFEKLNDRTLTTIEFRHFGLNDTVAQQSFFDMLRDGFLRSRGLVNMSDKVLKAVSQNIIELFDNAREHSQSECGIFCAGQLFPQKHKLDFTIVDMGVTIKRKVCDYTGEAFNAGEAIKWAMQRMNSTRDDIGGLGLALLKELIIKSGGKLEIISNNGLYFIQDGKEGYEDIEFEFAGTAINIEFNINDKYYVMKDEL
ncbi:MAG TPA: ATP-binding protein [Campylobacterales bacterium]|nr:ATP-binding protein [Campylobacterales bacterium]